MDVNARRLMGTCTYTQRDNRGIESRRRKRSRVRKKGDLHQVGITIERANGICRNRRFACFCLKMRATVSDTRKQCDLNNKSNQDNYDMHNKLLGVINALEY